MTLASRRSMWAVRPAIETLAGTTLESTANVGRGMVSPIKALAARIVNTKVVKRLIIIVVLLAVGHSLQVGFGRISLSCSPFLSAARSSAASLRETENRLGNCHAHKKKIDRILNSRACGAMMRRGTAEAGTAV